MSGNGSSNGSNDSPRMSLGTAAARNLATTTKTVPQMQSISSRWLLKMLPWVDVSGGTYRINQRLSHAPHPLPVRFRQAGSEMHVIPSSLRGIPWLSDVTDENVLAALARQFSQHEITAGSTLAEQGSPADTFYIVAHGRVKQFAAGRYDDTALIGVLAGGDCFGHETLTGNGAAWASTAIATTSGTVLRLPRQQLETLLAQSEELTAAIDQYWERTRRPQNRRGEADMILTSGHEGETNVHPTFADYEPAPGEHPLSVAQTVLRTHTRVADLYSHPMDQTEQQLRLTIEALRERQEREMVNNPRFGLLHNVHDRWRLQAKSGPPTPDDMDDLLSRRRSTRMFLAHPLAIAALGRECSRRGITPGTKQVEGQTVSTWRSVPVFPCDKLPVNADGTSTILAMRTGQDDQGVVGLQQTGLPFEHEPSVSVRFMGINDKAVISYLVSIYFSVAVLVPDALGALENVEVLRASDGLDNRQPAARGDRR